MQQRHFQQMWRREDRVTTRILVLPLLCTSISYLSHSDCLVVILIFYRVPMFLHAVTNFENQKAFSSKHMSFFIPRKYDIIFYYVTATLRVLFAWPGSHLDHISYKIRLYLSLLDINVDLFDNVPIGGQINLDWI